MESKRDAPVMIGVSDTEIIPRTKILPARLDSKQLRVHPGKTVVRFEGLPPGPSWVFFGPPSMEGARSQPVQLVAGAGVQHVLVILPPPSGGNPD